jgi:hypothetical protein
MPAPVSPCRDSSRHTWQRKVCSERFIKQRHALREEHHHMGCSQPPARTADRGSTKGWRLQGKITTCTRRPTGSAGSGCGCREWPRTPCELELVDETREFTVKRHPPRWCRRGRRSSRSSSMLRTVCSGPRSTLINASWALSTIPAWASTDCDTGVEICYGVVDGTASARHA